jgi:Tol biopolymer transport system component
MVNESLPKLLAVCLVSVALLPFTARSQTLHDRMESVSVSPDGKTIAADFIKGKTSHIFLIALDTGNATRFAKDSKGKESNLGFSPESKIKSLRLCLAGLRIR